MLQPPVDELELARGQGHAAFELPVGDLQAMDGGAPGSAPTWKNWRCSRSASCNSSSASAHIHDLGSRDRILNISCSVWDSVDRAAAAPLIPITVYMRAVRPQNKL